MRPVAGVRGAERAPDFGNRSYLLPAPAVTGPQHRIHHSRRRQSAGEAGVGGVVARDPAEEIAQLNDFQVLVADADRFAGVEAAVGGVLFAGDNAGETGADVSANANANTVTVATAAAVTVTVTAAVAIAIATTVTPPNQKHLRLIQPFKVPPQRAFFAVDFEREL
ncbi:MAG: hypothetical protein OXU96_02765, partial [Gammaproteobacteria bacterium]|nr:hypothetical protein [Gammaproteobacteria bacterium]